MAEQGHERARRHAGHGQAARSIVPEVVEVKVAHLEVAHEATEGDGEGGRRAAVAPRRPVWVMDEVAPAR